MPVQKKQKSKSLEQNVISIFTDKRFRNKELFPWYLGVIAVVVILVIMFYPNGDDVQNTPDISGVAESEVGELVEKVSGLMFLPEGEVPTVATVIDPERLSGQEFFVGVKKGDIVLIYSATRRAILYDPVANKIVNMASINVDL